MSPSSFIPTVSQEETQQVPNNHEISSDKAKLTATATPGLPFPRDLNDIDLVVAVAGPALLLMTTFKTVSSAEHRSLEHSSTQKLGKANLIVAH